MVGLVDGDSVKKATKEGFKTSLVILLAISLHAILAGVSMGIQSESENVYTVFVAIASHKAPAAFSIGSKTFFRVWPIQELLRTSSRVPS